MSDDDEIESPTTAKGFGRFIPHYTHEIHMAVPAVVGIESYAIYDYIRANTYFGEARLADSALGRLAALRHDGHLGTLTSAGDIAEALGWSLRTVERYLMPLRALGWIVVRDLGKASFAYMTGESTTNSNGDIAFEWFKEGMIEALHRAMRKHAAEKLDTPAATILSLSRVERREFTERWIAKRLAKVKAKAA